MKKPIISIAMTTYNGEKFLKKQILSILDQTYENLEIIICDDNSIDNTKNILKEFMNIDERIKVYFNKQNIGYVKNFEKAISLCKGDFIALSDQDDIWLKNKIEILYKNIGKYDLIHSDAYLIDEMEQIFSHSYSKYINKYLYPNNIIELSFSPIVTGCTCMFTKQLKNKIVPICDTIYVHDLWISMVAYNNNGIKYLEKPLIYYRQHSDNQIGVNRREMSVKLLEKLRHIKCYNQIFKEIEEVKKRILCLRKLDLNKLDLKLINKIENNLNKWNLLYYLYFYLKYTNLNNNCISKLQVYLKKVLKYWIYNAINKGKQ